ncbi:MAG: 3-methyl-2-oxobutanoate hydroxymethyltransferase [Phycisphaerae bacterium]|nr:3-methyl-2-oxobutanoate hydroxymethyltransferase [Phycisphaerae bacterium]
MAKLQRITISQLRARKREGRRFAMLTCYDHATAKLMEEAGVESLLVGDTYAEVCLGHPTTLPAELDHMVTIAEAVRRGAPSAYLVGDMPFLSYQVSIEDAVRNAGKFMARAGCDCVKLEVDRRHLRTVEALSGASIPVMAHLGLRPQSIQSLGGYRVQGREAEDAARIAEDAKMMESAGAVALLLEAVPVELAKIISEGTVLPVVGIASGPYCDAQVMVLHDMLGYGEGHPPRSVKVYAQLHQVLVDAFRSYAGEVRDGIFPTVESGVHMDPQELERFQSLLDSSDAFSD